MAKEKQYPYTLDEINCLFSLNKTQAKGVAAYLEQFRAYVDAYRADNCRDATVHLAYASDIEKKLGLLPQILDEIVKRFFC